MGMNVNLCGIELENPVIPASGTFGYGYEFAEIYDINELGTFSFKGTTREPRFGNPTPRIAECPGGMINAVGLQNPGVEKVISEELPRLKKVFHKPVMANVSGFSGPAIFPIAVRMVYQVAKAVKIPVIGMGGVSSAEDVIEMMLSGATAVEVGAANLVNPFASRDIVRALPEAMEKYGIKNLKDIIGGIQEWEKM